MKQQKQGTDLLGVWCNASPLCLVGRGGVLVAHSSHHQLRRCALGPQDLT